jgi:beta-lactamase superfamily II metal-dependent hydrolase
LNSIHAERDYVDFLQEIALARIVLTHTDSTADHIDGITSVALLSIEVSFAMSAPRKIRLVYIQVIY